MTDVTTSLWISLRISTAATFMIFLMGLPLAWALSRPGWRGRRMLDILVSLPLALPPTVLGYYLLQLLGRHGIIGRLALWLQGSTLLFTTTAAIIASVVVGMPLFVQAARNSLEDVPHEVHEAAQLDGAGAWAAFRMIFLPLAWPGVWTGVLLAYARSLGEFGATLMVAGNIPGRTQTLSLAIYSATQAGQNETATKLALLLTSVAAISLWLGLRFRKGAGR